MITHVICPVHRNGITVGGRLTLWDSAQPQSATLVGMYGISQDNGIIPSISNIYVLHASGNRVGYISQCAIQQRLVIEGAFLFLIYALLCFISIFISIFIIPLVIDIGNNLGINIESSSYVAIGSPAL